MINLRTSRSKYRLFWAFLGKYRPFFDDFFQVGPYTDFLRKYGPLYKHWIILTDLHTFYHPPATLPPLQVDPDKPGKDSDHNTVVFAPKNNSQYESKIEKTTIKTRPLPENNRYKFEAELVKYHWEEIFEGKRVDTQVEIFHDILRSMLDKYFPEKKHKNIKSRQKMDVS